MFPPYNSDAVEVLNLGYLFIGHACSPLADFAIHHHGLSNPILKNGLKNGASCITLVNVILVDWTNIVIALSKRSSSSGRGDVLDRKLNLNYTHNVLVVLHLRNLA